MNRTPVKKGAAGDRASAPTSKMTKAPVGSAKAVSSLSGEEVELPAEGTHVGQTRTVLGQGGDDSFTATAARMEWTKRQGNMDGVMDMEVSSAVSCMWEMPLIVAEGVRGGNMKGRPSRDLAWRVFRVSGTKNLASHSN